MALSFLCGALLFASGQVSAAAYAYKISVAVTIPKGYAGAVSKVYRPSNTKFTPCLENAGDAENTMDGVIFTVTYDAGKPKSTTSTTSEDSRRNVYLILYNPEVDPDLGGGPYYTISRLSLGNPQFILSSYIDFNALIAGAGLDPYLKFDENPGSGAITEQVFGGVINMKGVTSGTWQMVGIIAKDTVNFQYPIDPIDTTNIWEAWDVATLVVGKPWTGTDPDMGVCKDLVAK
jgi:hypothetical protein